MQTSNFILINHDIYGKNMVSICFIYFHLCFILRKFIYFHYLDQLHLVSSHASRQMCTMYFVPSLFIIVNKKVNQKEHFHATFEKFLENFILILTKTSNMCSGKSLRTEENFYKNVVFLSLTTFPNGSFSSPGFPVSLCSLHKRKYYE